MRRTAYAGIALAILAVMSGSIAASSTTTSAAVVVHPPVRAHRGGLHFDIVENTQSNFHASALEGRTLWETDVRFTSTNTPVLLHDANLKVFGCPTIAIASVSQTTAREKCIAPNGQVITSLYNLFQEMRANPTAQVFVELKTVPTAVQWDAIDERLLQVQSRVVITSFIASVLPVASARGYATGLITSTPVAPSTLPAGTDVYSPAWNVTTAAQVDAMHAAGKKVSVWTVGTLDRDSVPSGVDEIISNDVLYGG